MWIIPKNLNTLASVQDTGALIWDLNELSELCEQSLLVRSSTTQRKTWLQKLKRDYLTARLFGRTLRPSRGARFADEWTCSLGASLASPSAPPVDEQETATPATYGHTSPAVSESWADLPLFSSKMWRGSSALSSPAQIGQTPQTRPFCSMSSASWSAWITAQRREYSARAKLAPHTSVSACLLWACEMTSTSPRALLFQSCLSAQGEAISPLGPLDEEPHNTPGSPHESRGETTWATPSQGDGIRLGCETTEQWRQRAERKKAEGINLHRPLNIEALLDAETQTPPPTGQLNPRWVEPLMGLPVGWTMASCAAPWIIEPTNLDYLETELYQQQQSEPLEPCGGAWGTPRLSTANARPRAGARGPNTEYRIENQVLDTWPTPQARDHKGSSGRSNLGLELDLPAAVKATTTTTPAQTQGTPNNEPST